MSQEIDKPKENSRWLSRREFIKDAGIVVGGVALASLALSSACQNAEKTSISTTTDTANSNPYTSPLATTSSPEATTTPAETTSGPSDSSGTTSPVTSTSDIPNLIDIPGCSTKVATDRLYSTDNIWVKNLGNNTVQIGITDEFQLLIGLIDTCWVSPPASVLKVEESFGDIEGYKMSVDLISPVSGKVLATNQSVIEHPAPLLNGDPYITGWMLNIQMSNPADLNNLVTPMYYAYLKSEGWTGPVPSMH
jgi:glycine cleavage system H protein